MKRETAKDTRVTYDKCTVTILLTNKWNFDFQTATLTLCKNTFDKSIENKLHNSIDKEGYQRM